MREFINENDLKGVFIRPTSKRPYPKGTLASQVIGFTNDLGGAMGLEAAYNDELTGENGMVVTARDRDGRSVLYQYDQYFDAENGCDLHTTLDTTIPSPSSTSSHGRRLCTLCTSVSLRSSSAERPASRA